MAINSSLTRVFIISNIVLVLVIAFLLFNKKDSRNELFENNLKCSKYIEQESQRVASMGSSIGIKPTIFYSPSKHTCISAYIVVNSELGYTGYYIEDILTNNTIYSKGAHDSTPEDLQRVEEGFVAEQKLLMQ